MTEEEVECLRLKREFVLTAFEHLPEMTHDSIELLRMYGPIVTPDCASNVMKAMLILAISQTMKVEKEDEAGRIWIAIASVRDLIADFDDTNQRASDMAKALRVALKPRKSDEKAN